MTETIPATQAEQLLPEEEGVHDGIYHTASRSLADLASAQFIAKTLYPQQFADIDPNKTYLDFYRKYLPVVPDGTFYIQLK